MANLAAKYQAEWARELRAQGITPNGSSYKERHQQERLANARANKLKAQPTAMACLKASAAAFKRAQEKGFIKVDSRGFFVATGRVR